MALGTAAGRVVGGPATTATAEGDSGPASLPATGPAYPLTRAYHDSTRGFRMDVPGELNPIGQELLDRINAAGLSKQGVMWRPFLTGYVDADGAVRVLVAWTDQVRSSADLKDAKAGAALAGAMSSASTRPEDQPNARIDPAGTTLIITRRDATSDGAWVNATSVVRLGRDGAVKVEFLDPPLLPAVAQPDAWRQVTDSIRFDPGFEHVPPPPGTAGRSTESEGLAVYSSLLVPMAVLAGVVVLGGVILTAVRLLRVRRRIAELRAGRERAG